MKTLSPSAIAPTPPNPWREPEEEVLERHCTAVPFPLLVERLQRYQQSKGWPVRTKLAIETKVKRMGLGFRCTIDNLNGKELADALGVSPYRINNWKKRHDMPFLKLGTCLAYVPLSKFRNWAMQNPRLLADVPRENLLWVIQNEALVDKILETPSVQRGKSKPVCSSDGTVYPTIADAARANFMTPPGLHHALLNCGGMCAGYQFEFIALS